MKKLEDGFFSISGAAVDAAGKLYFVDHHNQRIYSLVAERRPHHRTRQSARSRQPRLRQIGQPAGALLRRARKARSTPSVPDSSAEELTVLAAAARAASCQCARVILPVNWWNNGEFKDQLDLDTMRFTTLAEMFAADVSTPRRRAVRLSGWQCISARRPRLSARPCDGFLRLALQRQPRHLRFLTAEPGQRVYVSSESEDITYSAKVNSDGTLTDLRPFAQRGGESVAIDRNGNVYVANGQIFVYAPSGQQIAQIDVPERPLQLIFGGADRKTLFILAHHALFAAQVR